ncbi:MAG TPA: AAA family ATPase, partial [Verrucomicrobiota bacterium]|nr:AAA family ATPase [Verrucomicrobiota bacterium]
MENTETTHEEDRQAVEQIAAGREQIEQELNRVIIGQKEAIEEILVTLFAGGNCLITGVPGLAKTLMVRAIAGIFDLGFHRIQFTPDLMPADITGTEILTDGEHGR